MVIMISDRYLGKILNVSGNLSTILSAHGLKLFIQAVSPETFSVDRFINWSVDYPGSFKRILREYNMKPERNLDIDLAGICF